MHVLREHNGTKTEFYRTNTKSQGLFPAHFSLIIIIIVVHVVKHNNNNNNNNNNTQIAAIALPPSTTHTKLWAELLTFKPECTIA